MNRPSKGMKRRGKKRTEFRLALEQLETRRLLASVSAPAILQWFESSFDTIENRTPDIFDAGYGSVWLPPPGRADSGGFSVGYDPYDRFDLGSPDNPTLYGTETGLKTVSDAFESAGIQLHVDTVLNHAGFSDAGTPGFVESGGYPGLAITLPDAIDGDFHSGFEGGDLRGRLAGLVDINHSTNHQFIRQPVDPNDPRNIPAGTTPAFGRLANVPTTDNLRFYPDRDLDPILLFDPSTGENGIATYPFNPDCPECGDPVPENALGYEMRYMQWLVQEIGVDGLRLDATKHFDQFVLEFLDRAVYRSNPRLLLDGSVDHVFSYGEAFTGDRDALLSYVRKDINPADPGRIGGNRDTLDFSAFFAMHDNLGSAGTSDAWFNVRNSLLDLHDDGIHNGSAGVLFVASHDENGPSELGNVAQAFALMYPGNTVVYFNGKEFGDNRDFPKNGRGDALGGVYGDGLKRLVQIRNTHGRGDFFERYISGDGLYIYERESSAVVGLSNRGDNGFDERTVSVAFAPGTHLVELTGNASNSFIDPNDDIPDVVTVKADGTIDIRVPRNRNANGDFHGNGYVIYGLPTPQAPGGLEVIGSSSVLEGSIPDANDFANGVSRLSDLNVITTDTFDLRLQTNEVRLLGQDSLRDVFADGDSALFRIDGGTDANGNGGVDFVAPGTASYGFETFGDKSSSLIGGSGVSGPRGDGEFLQTIDATTLSEGVHYIDARAFRHRTDGGPAVYSEFKQSIYVDRLAPESAVKSFEPWEEGVSENRNLVIESVDKTADSVHVFLDLPAGTTDAEILQRVFAGEGSARQIDRDQFIFGFPSLSHGNHVATIVTFEQTGSVNVQRSPGLFTSTIFGAGLGDVNFDGQINLVDQGLLVDLIAADNTEFNPAADFNADGLIDAADLDLFHEDYVDQLRGPVDFGDAPSSYVRPFFSDRINAGETPITLSVPGGDVGIQSTVDIPLNGLSRDDSANDSLYIRFTATPQSAAGDHDDAFAGLQLFQSGSESVGIGNRYDSEQWSYFGIGADGDLNSGNADAGGTTESLVDGQARTVLVKIQYVPGQDDSVTVWLQPEDVLDNAQPAAITTTFDADASFDGLRLRSGSDVGSTSWTFSNISIAQQLKPGPAHLIAGDLKLGLLVDPDGGQQTSDGADGDDLDGSDDEDGAVVSAPLIPGGTWPVTITAGAAGKIDGWVDYNRNGRFDHPSEHIGGGVSIDVAAGTDVIHVSVPAWAEVGSTAARFRISTAGELTPNSYAADGEVEDAMVTIIDAPPAIAAIRIASSGWDSSLINHVDPELSLGHRVASDSNQLATMPWAGIDRVYVQFTEDVSGTVDAGDFHVTGVNTASPSFTMAYDAENYVATLTFDSPLTTDKYRLVIDDSIEDAAGKRLDGEWTTGSAASRSGDGVDGGRFDYRFNLLPGDANQDGLVTGGDLQVIGAALDSVPADEQYSALADLDGDGAVVAADAQVIGAFFFQQLPVGEPSTPPEPAPLAAQQSADAARVLAIDTIMGQNTLDSSTGNGSSTDEVTGNQSANRDWRTDAELREKIRAERVAQRRAERAAVRERRRAERAAQREQRRAELREQRRIAHQRRRLAAAQKAVDDSVSVEIDSADPNRLGP